MSESQVDTLRRGGEGMIGQLQRASSWTGRIAVLAIALLGAQLHATGTPERALAQAGVAVLVGSVIGLAMLAIVAARLIGRNIGLIRSDRQAMAALAFMIVVKVAIARVLVP